MKSARYSTGLLRMVSAAGLFVATLSFIAPNASATTASIPYFSAPDAIAVSGSDVWVANLLGNSVTEFNVSDGSLVRVINAKADRFHRPTGIAVGGSHVWVTNSNEELGMGTTGYPLAKYSSVTELNVSNGSLVRVINAKADKFLQPGPIAIGGSHVWVVNANSGGAMNALVELNASNGSLFRVFKGTTDGLNGPLGIAASGSHVWVTCFHSITELNARSGSLVRVINAKADGLIAPDGVAVGGSLVWIANIRQGENSITELNASNGSLVRVIKAKADRFNGLLGITANTSHVWVTNGNGYENGTNTNSITELNASNGSLVRVINLKADGLYGPTAVVASGSKLWVLNTNSVTELKTSDGSLVRVIK